MILNILYTDGELQKFDLTEYMFTYCSHCLTVTKNIGWENYDINTCETEVIPYTNIYKWWTKNVDE